MFVLECSLRFSRLTLSVDTGVSTVSFAEDGDGGYDISFEATSYPLPIVQGTADYSLPPDCVISALAVNRATGWRTVDHGGFSLRYNGQDAFLEVNNFNCIVKSVPFYNRLTENHLLELTFSIVS